MTMHLLSILLQLILHTDIVIIPNTASGLFQSNDQLDRLAYQLHTW